MRVWTRKCRAAVDVWAEFWSSQPCGICICQWVGRFGLWFNFFLNLFFFWWPSKMWVGSRRGVSLPKDFKWGVLCAIRNVQWKIEMMNLIFFFFFPFPLEMWGSLISLLFCVEWREGGRKDSLFEEAYCWLQSLVNKRAGQRGGGMKRREKHWKKCWECVIFLLFPPL